MSAVVVVHPAMAVVAVVAESVAVVVVVVAVPWQLVEDKMFLLQASGARTSVVPEMDLFPSSDTANWDTSRSGLGKTEHQCNLDAVQILLLIVDSFLTLPCLVGGLHLSDLAYLAKPASVNV